MGGDTEDIVDELNNQACMRGCQLTPANAYAFGLTPYVPGQGFVTGGAFGRPSGAGGAFVGVSAGAGFAGTVGTQYAPGSGGGVGLGVGGGIGGSPDVLNALRANGQVGFFGGGLGGPGSSVGVGIVPGVGYGYGQGWAPGFSPSYGYTSGVGGSFGGGMGGSFGPGIGGGLGGWGSESYGNPLFFQSGNPLVQNFLQSPYGEPTGTPYGLAITSAGPATQNVYAFTAGIGPDGTLQTSSYAGSGYNANPYGIGAYGGPGYPGGFGSSVYSPSPIFGGGADVAAVAGFGAGISGDGAFGMQAMAGVLDPTLSGLGNPPCNLGY